MSSRVSNVMSCSDFLLRWTSILPFDLYWFCVLARALLHFLDSDKFKSKEQFTEHYKNLSSFDEKEVCCHLWWQWTLVAEIFAWLWIVICALWRNYKNAILLVKCYHSHVMSSPITTQLMDIIHSFLNVKYFRDSMYNIIFIYFYVFSLPIYIQSFDLICFGE